ncbi:MAG: type II toxin-antitoxin system RelE/ParE family toxin [Chitinophagaceae bacterium]|nr:type II toxin-antitoxin system RelE/ParE family toxin [Chitinophagaceae bacterium]
MVYKVIWSPLAIKTYIENIEHLEVLWTDKEILIFINSVKRKIHLLTTNPNLGSPTTRRKNVRKSVIHKRVVLFYRVKSAKKEIELIRFWATRRNPGNLKF